MVMARMASGIINIIFLSYVRMRERDEIVVMTLFPIAASLVWPAIVSIQSSSSSCRYRDDVEMMEGSGVVA